MLSCLTEASSLKTYLSITTEEPQPTASLVPSRNTNWPRPSCEVLIRSSRCTASCSTSGPFWPDTSVLMSTAWPTASAACTEGAVANMPATSQQTAQRTDDIASPRRNWPLAVFKQDSD